MDVKREGCSHGTRDVDGVLDNVRCQLRGCHRAMIRSGFGMTYSAEPRAYHSLR